MKTGKIWRKDLEINIYLVNEKLNDTVIMLISNCFYHYFCSLFQSVVFKYIDFK